MKDSLLNSFRQYRSDACFDIDDGVDVAGAHLAQSGEIGGDVVPEHDRVHVLLNSYWTVTVFTRDGWNLERVFSNETELTRRISRILDGF